jgi:hypothetical protein
MKLFLSKKHIKEGISGGLGALLRNSKAIVPFFHF